MECPSLSGMKTEQRRSVSVVREVSLPGRFFGGCGKGKQTDHTGGDSPSLSC
jgi:hypothetical protein